MATTWLFSPDIFLNGSLADVGAVSGDFFANDGGGAIETPSFGGRSGSKALRVAGNGTGTRFVLKNGAQNTIFLHAAFYNTALPPANYRMRVRFADAGNSTLAWFHISPTGVASIQNAANLDVAATPAPVFNAGEWTLFEMKVVMAGTASSFELRNETGTVLLLATGLTLSASPIAQIELVAGEGSVGAQYYVSDLWVKDNTGTQNNNFGPARVYARALTADHPGGGWGFTARRKISAGVLHLPGDGAIRIQDTAALELGASDFTIEGFFRANALLTAGQSQPLVSQWYDAGGNNERSWRLRRYERSGTQRLSFEVSTAGTAGSVVAVHDAIWTPTLNEWYHVAVSRSAGTSMLFINGVRLTPAATDANTYFNGNANFSVGGQSLGVTIDGATLFAGFADEVRLTVGAARYTAEFAPPTSAFPRSGADPQWANTQVLLGFDGVVGDESQFSRAVSLHGTVSAHLPDDGLAAYQSLDKIGRNDTFIRAALLPASGTVEFVSNAVANDTITIGARTYTFVTALSAADQVLIGASAEITLSNLRAAVNQDAGAGTIYGTGTVAHAAVSASDIAGSKIAITALTAGTAGNSIVLSTNVAGAVLSGATLAGGADIPAASEFSFQTLPPGVTGIRSVMLATKRSLVGVGSANARFSIRNAGGTLILGQDHTPPANPAWQMDIFDTDAGGSAWSTAALIGARTHNNRTS